MSLIEYVGFGVLAVAAFVRAIRVLERMYPRCMEAFQPIYPEPIVLIFAVLLTLTGLGSVGMREDRYVLRPVSIETIPHDSMRRVTHHNPPYTDYSAIARVLPAGHFGVFYYPEETIAGYEIFQDKQLIGEILCR